MIHDARFTALLENEDLNLPKTLPDGEYNATMMDPDTDSDDDSDTEFGVCMPLGFDQEACEANMCCRFDDGECAPDLEEYIYF